MRWLIHQYLNGRVLPHPEAPDVGCREVNLVSQNDTQQVNTNSLLAINPAPSKVRTGHKVRATMAPGCYATERTNVYRLCKNVTRLDYMGADMLCINIRIPRMQETVNRIFADLKPRQGVCQKGAH